MKRTPKKPKKPNGLVNGHSLPAPRPTIQTRKINGFNSKFGTHEKLGEEHVDPFLAADVTLTAQIAECLERHYPSHPWMVKVTHAQGVAMISLPLLMDAKQPYVLHIANLKGDPTLKRVMRAGGAILERLNLPRQGFSLDKFLHARERGPYRRRTPKLILPEFATSARPGDNMRFASNGLVTV